LIVISSFYLLFLSLVPHKEERFILPILPFLMYIAGDYLSKKLKVVGSYV
jgi:hypothetical protein